MYKQIIMKVYYYCITQLAGMYNTLLLDNELPDYIMVMLANKKTLNQIANDLQLFLGDNIEPFMDW